MNIAELCSFYDRMVALHPDAGIPEFGWTDSQIPFVICITMDGRLVSVDDTRTKVRSGKSSKLVARMFRVPSAQLRGNNVVARFLVDRLDYALGIPFGKSGPEKAAECHAAFMKRLYRHSDTVPEIGAVVKFLESPGMVEGLASLPEYEEILATVGAVVTFRIAGSPHPTVFGFQSVKDAVRSEAEVDASENVYGDVKCMDCVTGVMCNPVKLHPKVHGVAESNSYGASLVSFNAQSATCYGRDGGMNAPMSTETVFKYSTALDMLLAKGSRHHVRVGNVDYLFWGDSETPVEDCVRHFLSYDTDPSENADCLRTALSALRTGLGKDALDATVGQCADTFFRFVALAAPSKSRISVRMWDGGTAVELASALMRWFDDLDLGDGGVHMTARRILNAIAPNDKKVAPNDKKVDDVNPGLMPEILASAFHGTPLPRRILLMAVQRNMRDRKVTTYRAAILKAYVNRLPERTRKINGMERNVEMGLDPENRNTGYLLGRLLAVCDRIQQCAGTVSDGCPTVGDRFFRGASSNPRNHFWRILSLAKIHLAKISRTRQGLAVVLERELSGIVDLFNATTGIPRTMTPEASAMFGLGYYHQKIEDDKGKNGKSEVSGFEGNEESKFSEKSGEVARKDV